MNERGIDGFVGDYLSIRKNIIDNGEMSGRQLDLLLIHTIIERQIRPMGGPQFKGMKCSSEVEDKLVGILDRHWHLIESQDGFFPGELFERLMDSDSKKAWGQFYTPRGMASLMARRALGSYILGKINRSHNAPYADIDHYLSSAHFVKDPKLLAGLLLNVRVLDPACGCGNFLEAMLDEILAMHQRVRDRNMGLGGLSESALVRHIVENNIYGVDISADAANIARARLASRCGATFPRRVNIEQGDSLIGFTSIDPNAPDYLGANDTKGMSAKDLDDLFQRRFGEDGMELRPFHWAKMFAPDKGFDIVIGNPPYGKLKNSKQPIEMKRALSRTYKSLYQKTGSNIDLYKLFIERCMGLVGPEGVLSLVIPSMFWGDKESYLLRKELYDLGAEYITILHLDETKRCFKGMINYEVSLFSASSATGHERKIDVYTSIHGNGPAYSLKRNEIFSNSRLLRLPIFNGGPLERDIFDHISGHDRLAGMDVHIFVGKLDESLDKEHISDEPTGELLVASNHIKDWYLDLASDTMKKRWASNSGLISKRRLKKQIMGARNVGELMSISPKIVGRQMANRGERRKLHFTMEFGNHMLTNGVRTILVDSKDTRLHHTLLSFLNSSLINWYFSLYSRTYNVKPYELLELPMPKMKKKTIDHFSALSNMMLFSMALSKNGDPFMNEVFSRLNTLLDACVYDLMLFDGGDGIVDMSKGHLCPLDFGEWSLMPLENRNGDVTTFEAKRSLGSSISSIGHDNALGASMERVFSHGWTKTIEGALGAPKRL